MIIEGASIILRDWMSKDIPDFSYWIQPHHKWHDFDGPYYKINEIEAAEKVKVLEKKINEGHFSTPRTRLVVADRQTDRLLGTGRLSISRKPQYCSPRSKNMVGQQSYDEACGEIRIYKRSMF